MIAGGAALACGFFGKLPARGDFVQAGLPSWLVRAWDAWCSAGLAASRGTLGDAWRDAWMQAPVWRFLLPTGLAGPGCALGLWMPSIDRAGRCFPLMLAAAAPPGTEASLLATGGGMLAALEDAGLMALAHDTPPDALAQAALQAVTAPPSPCGAAPAPGETLWWTEGGPHVAPASFHLPGLPPPDRFAAMLHTPIPETVPDAS